MDASRRRDGGPWVLVAGLVGLIVVAIAGVVVMADLFSAGRAGSSVTSPAASSGSRGPGASSQASEPAAASVPSEASGPAEPRASANTAIAPPDILAPNAFAAVVVEAVQLQEQPSLNAPGVSIPVPDAVPQPAMVGIGTPVEHVYVLDGPIQADGLAWFHVAPSDGDHEVAPQLTGWIPAARDDGDVLRVEDPCPQAPVTLEDLTFAAMSWAVRLGCFRDGELTLVGWFPELPPDIVVPTQCPVEPAFLMCSAVLDIRPLPMDFYDERNVNRLDFTVDPGMRVPMPERGQWIQITGRFDHPASAACPRDTDLGTLYCRMQFVVTSARPAAPPAT